MNRRCGAWWRGGGRGAGRGAERGEEARQGDRRGGRQGRAEAARDCKIHTRERAGEW